MGTLIVVSGPPGSGKSSVAEHLAAGYDPSAVVAGDAVFAFLRQGFIEPWAQRAHPQNRAVVEASAAAAGRLAEHCTVVHDGVVGPWLLEGFVAASGLDRVHYAVLLPPEETCVERVRRRRGHGFTDESATRQLWRDFDLAPLDPRHVVVDTTSDAAGIAREVRARVERGTIAHPSAEAGQTRAYRARAKE